MPDLKTIGLNIKAERVRHGLTQKDVAKKLHVADVTVSNWECGNTPIDVRNLCNLADCLSVSIDGLVGRS